MRIYLGKWVHLIRSGRLSCLGISRNHSTLLFVFHRDKSSCEEKGDEMVFKHRDWIRPITDIQ